MNYKTMALLDKANTETFGTPRPTEVPLGHKAGKAILVSGHDLGALEALLKQTEGKGITVYTNGEMLPAHAYPKLKAYPHLYGNYGGAWFKPEEGLRRVPRRHPDDHQLHPDPAADTYEDKLFTNNVVDVAGISYIEGPRLQRR